MGQRSGQELFNLQIVSRCRATPRRPASTDTSTFYNQKASSGDGPTVLVRYITAFEANKYTATLSIREWSKRPALVIDQGRVLKPELGRGGVPIRHCRAWLGGDAAASHVQFKADMHALFVLGFWSAAFPCYLLGVNLVASRAGPDPEAYHIASVAYRWRMLLFASSSCRGWA